jgi:hypothetical protein
VDSTWYVIGTHYLAVAEAEQAWSLFIFITDATRIMCRRLQVGVSQGGLVARAFVQKYNSPKVYNLVSVCDLYALVVSVASKVASDYFVAFSTVADFHVRTSKW